MFVEVKNAVKQYGSGDAAVYALNGADFSLEKGEIGVILGSSGSGKSTFLRCLNLLERPTSGQIIFDDEDRLTERFE